MVKQTWWREWLGALIVLALFLLAQLVASSLAFTLFEFDTATPPVRGLLLIETVVLLFAAVYLFEQRVTIRDTELFRAPAWKAWLATSPIILLFIVVPLGLAFANGETLVHESLSSSRLMGLLGFAALVGIAEELWFRVAMIAKLGGASRYWTTIFGSAFLFALPHALSGEVATTVNSLAVGLAVGVPFAIIRLETGRLAPLIVAHFLIDAWAFSFTGGVTPPELPSTSEAALQLILPAGAAAGYIAWAINAQRIRRAHED